MEAAAAPEGSASAEGVKRSADAPAAGESPAKAAKVEPAVKQEEVKKEEVKKEEIKKEVKAENGDEKKEKKEKKDKSEKKEKKEKKEENGVKKEPKALANVAELDHRKLFKEGQRFLTPPMADSTRAFYESLYAENPDSKIAIRFCVEYGLFPLDVHKQILKKYLHLKEKGAYDVRAQIKRALEKKEKMGEKDKKDKKDKKEKKEKDGEKKEKKEEKEKKEKDEKDKAPAA